MVPRNTQMQLSASLKFFTSVATGVILGLQADCIPAIIAKHVGKKPPCSFWPGDVARRTEEIGSRGIYG